MSRRVRRAREVGAGLIVVVAVMPAAARASATDVADTTRGGSADPVVQGRSPTLTVGSANILLRFAVSGLGAAPSHAVLRLRVTDTSTQSLNVRLAPEPDFVEDGKQKSGIYFQKALVTKGKPAAVGAWTEYDVTSAVKGNGPVSFQITGSFVDPASFSSREGPDAPQLVVTPDDPTQTDLAAKLDLRSAPTVRVGARDDIGRSLDGLEVAVSPEPAQGRYLGVYHTFLGDRFVTSLGTSDDLLTWTHRVDLADHGGQASIAIDPGGGVIVADEADTPDPQWVSVSQVRVRHYANVDNLLLGTYDTGVLLPRTLSQTNEGTPEVSIARWGLGPGDSELRITFHYLRNVDVDRQAVGTLTNFATWATAPDDATNALLETFGIRGNIGDRSDVLWGGRPFGVVEGQLVKGNWASWRLFLVDRSRGEARMVSAKLPAGGYSLGNPSVKVLPAPSGAPVMFESVYAFSEGAPTEAGSAIALTPLT